MNVRGLRTGLILPAHRRRRKEARTGRLPIRAKHFTPKSGGRFHFHFGIEVGDDVLECLDRLLDRCDLHQLPVLDRPVAILQRDDQIPPLLLKLNKR